MRPLVPVLLAFGLGLAGCGPVNRGLESVHQPVVARADHAVDMRRGPDGLAPGEAGRLAAWFDAMQLRYGDRVTVDAGADEAFGGSEARDAVAAVVARYGLLLGDAPPVTAGAVPPGDVRVIVSRSTATVPGCPDWSRPSQPNLDGSTDSDFGCATNTNLAAMVADPQDLVAGRTGRASLSTRAATRAVRAYDDLVPTGAGGTVKQEGVGKK